MVRRALRSLRDFPGSQRAGRPGASQGRDGVGSVRRALRQAHDRPPRQVLQPSPSLAEDGVLRGRARGDGSLLRSRHHRR